MKNNKTSDCVHSLDHHVKRHVAFSLYSTGRYNGLSVLYGKRKFTSAVYTFLCENK